MLTKPRSLEQFIGSRVSQRRADLGWSTYSLAESLTIAEQRLVSCERGETRFTARELFSLGSVLRVPLVYFFFDD